MNIKTQEVLNQIHEVRCKLSIQQSKAGYDFCINTDIQACDQISSFIYFNGYTESNSEMPKEYTDVINADLLSIKLKYPNLF